MLQKPIYRFFNLLIKLTNKPVSWLVGPKQGEGAERKNVSKKVDILRKSHNLLFPRLFSSKPFSFIENSLILDTMSLVYLISLCNMV